VTDVTNLVMPDEVNLIPVLLSIEDAAGNKWHLLAYANATASPIGDDSPCFTAGDMCTTHHQAQGPLRATHFGPAAGTTATG
jgi:hypothetical protein